jgi:hypothetical protein
MALERRDYFRFQKIAYWLSCFNLKRLEEMEIGARWPFVARVKTDMLGATKS